MIIALPIQASIPITITDVANHIVRKYNMLSILFLINNSIYV